MKIGLLHLTDIHFRSKTDINGKIKSLVSVVSSEFREATKIYVVLSGDIAYSGKNDEYQKAGSFLSILKQFLQAELKELKLDFIIVPGNHDCDFENETGARKALNKLVSYDTLGDDKSVVDQLLDVQGNFWKFYAKYNIVPTDRVYYTFQDSIGGRNIVFHCLNTALTSKLKEEAGGLFFPCKKYTPYQIDKNCIHFGVWHHPANWFNPKTAENNKVEFERFIENLASTHFLGHEHVQGAFEIENLNTNKTINLLSGEVFHDENKLEKSGFQTIVYDLDAEHGTRKVYSWEKDHYKNSLERVLALHKEAGRVLAMKDAFFRSILEIKIPIVIENRKDINLSDIFVYQDLESAFRDNNKLEYYLNSAKLLDSAEGVYVLDGESQVGKSSLLAMLCFKFYEHGFYPILLKGKEITDLNLDKYVRRAFKVQYMEAGDCDKYLQLPKHKKIILIDDFHDSEFSLAAVKEFFSELKSKFGNSFVTTDVANNILSSAKSEVQLAKSYTIKPLGYKKRNELIERYLSLKNNRITYKENVFFSEVKDLFDNVQAVLGDKLMPSYPIYILSIIQALQYKPLKNETSFGYCYQTLIHYSLVSVGVTNDELDSYFNFLTEIAYDFLNTNIDVKSHSDMNKFFAEYSSRFIAPPYDTIMKSLKKSKILKSDDNGVSFGYSYILFYLSAKKISDILNTREGAAILERLFSRLESEKNANVLVFVTHHSKDVSFIETSLLNLMAILEKVKPITLEKDDPYYSHIAHFVQDIKNDVIDVNRNHREERERMLIANDKVAQARENRRLESEGYDEIGREMLPFLQAYRAIEIVGQILKNRRGSIEKPQLKSMIEELYTTGFRTVTYYNEILNAAKDEIISTIRDEVEEGETKRQIEDRIKHFIQFVSFKMCVGVFSKLTQSAGNKELRQLYIEVAAGINTPAAKVLTFGINLGYSSLNMSALANLADELRDNYVALRLLKARVRGYVYNNDIDYATKQKIASILHMDLLTKPGKQGPS